MHSLRLRYRPVEEADMPILPPPRTAGIYKITCIPTGKFYIGSSVNIRKRWQVHYRTLQNGVHDNAHLQSAWAKHGADSFDFEIIESVLFVEDLITREQYYLDTLQPYKKNIGFNKGKIAEMPMLGSTMSDESREKQSRMRRGKPTPWLHTPEVRARAKAGMPMRPRPSKELIERREATKKRNYEIRGYHHTPEARQKISATWAKRPKIPHHLVITPDGEEILVHLTSFCKEHDLDYVAMHRVVRGKYKHHKGYKARRID